MSINYQTETFQLIDYDLWCIPELNFYLRGPRCHFASSTPTISFIGAAQTFGAFAKYPFAAQVSEMLGAECLNLGRGGAGPRFYLNNPKLIDLINNSNACVVQVMSARSSMYNSYMESTHDLASVRITQGKHEGKVVLGHKAIELLKDELSEEQVRSLLNETIDNFLKDYENLLARIKVPTTLVYVSKRDLLPEVDTWSTSELYKVGIHPHFITQSVFERLSSLCDNSLKVVGQDGFDSRLINRFTGEYAAIKRSETYTVRKQDAYISAHMHSRTALELFPLLKGNLET